MKFKKSSEEMSGSEKPSLLLGGSRVWDRRDIFGGAVPDEPARRGESARRGERMAKEKNKKFTE